MPEIGTRLESGLIPDGGSKVRLLGLDDLDGRTSAIRRVKDTAARISADLGGDLSEAQRALARRASVMNAILDDCEARWAVGEPFLLADYLSAVNAQRRVLTTLGIHRIQRRVNGDRLSEAMRGA